MLASLWPPCWQRLVKVARHAPIPKTTLGKVRRLSKIISLVRLVVMASRPYMMIVKLTPEAILMMVRCEEGRKVRLVGD